MAKKFEAKDVQVTLNGVTVMGTDDFTIESHDSDGVINIEITNPPQEEPRLCGGSIKVEFCPSCRFRFITPTRVTPFKPYVPEWSVHGYSCTRCDLAYAYYVRENIEPYFMERWTAAFYGYNVINIHKVDQHVAKWSPGCYPEFVPLRGV